jgi:hypothetical protein
MDINRKEAFNTENLREVEYILSYIFRKIRRNGTKLGFRSTLMTLSTTALNGS